MKKIMKCEINRKLKECNIGIYPDDFDDMFWCSIHHVHGWDHGYETYCGYNGTRREFYVDFQQILHFISQYLINRGAKNVIVAPCYRYNQFEYIPKQDDKNYDIYTEIYSVLKKNNIRRGDQSGVKIEIKKDFKYVEAVLEGAFRGVSRLCLFLYEIGVLIVPDHHFGITFFTNSLEKEIETINLLFQENNSFVMNVRQEDGSMSY